MNSRDFHEMSGGDSVSGCSIYAIEKNFVSSDRNAAFHLYFEG
jgi:hypothetical protein